MNPLPPKRLPRTLARAHPIALAATTLLLATGPAAAQGTYWNCSGTQNWTAACWVNSAGNAVAPPVNGEYAVLRNASNGARVVNLSTATANLSGLTLDTTGVGTMTLNVLPGATLRSGDASLGVSGLASSNIVQSGGLHEAQTLWMSLGETALSSYSLSGGTLSTQSTVVGYWNNANFWQTGGTHVTNSLNVSQSEGTTASYALSGSGVLQTEQLRLATGYPNSSANFNHSGGRNDASLVIASAGGHYNLSGNGVLNADLVKLSHGTNNFVGGEFVQTGGTANIGMLLLVEYDGRFKLTGTGIANTASVTVADGSFEQLAGTHTVAGALTVTKGGLYRMAGGMALADSVALTGPVEGARLQLQGGQFSVSGALTADSGSTGGIELASGTLLTGQTVVGGTGRGAFVQTGGQHQVGSLVLGDGAAGQGSFTLAGGTLVSTGATIGQAGQGSFIQGAGHHEAGLLTLGGSAGGSGSYTLQGGTLASSTVRVGGLGGGSFVQQGGTHQVVQSLKIDAGGHYALQGGLLDLGALDAQVADGGTLQLAGGQLTGQRLRIDGRLHVSAASTVAAPIDLGLRSQAQIDAPLTLQGTMTLRQNVAHAQGVVGSGLIVLAGTGRITGQGVVGVDVANGGLVQARGGALTLAGASLINTGTLRNDVGATLFVDSATVQNSGRLQVSSAGAMAFTNALNAGAGSLIELGGGTLAASTLNHGDGAVMRGFGTVVGEIVNGGEVEFFGPSVVLGGFHNTKGGLLTVRNEQTLVTGLFVNDGTIRAIGGQIAFEGGLENHGGYVSEPSLNTFSTLLVGAEGWLDAQAGDRFVLTGDFLNHSGRVDAWDTSSARLVFSGPGERRFELAGADLGATATGLAGNFAWAALEIDPGTTLALSDGNGLAGAALYVGALSGALIDGDRVTNLRGEGVSVYYDPSSAANAYLAGRGYRLQDGGALLAMAPVPEPGTHALWLAGIGVLGWRLRVHRARRA